MSRSDGERMLNEMIMLRIKYGLGHITHVFHPDDVQKAASLVDRTYIDHIGPENRSFMAASMLAQAVSDMIAGSGETKRLREEIARLILYLCTTSRPDIADAIRKRQLVLLVVYLSIEDGKVFWPAHMQFLLDRDLVSPAVHPWMAPTESQVAKHLRDATQHT